MAAGGIRGSLGFVSWVLIATSILFLFFVVLSGVTGTTPLNKTYFLQADTSGISGARPTSQWTYFYVCGAGNSDCGDAVPALPFGDAWGSGATGVPDALFGKHHGTSSHYYYLWRFGWVFYLMALVFDVIALFLAFLSCLRIGAGLAGLVAAAAWFFMTLGASLMTAEFVMARNRFRDAGLSAKIGTYAFAWTWAAWACITIAVILLFSGAAVPSSSSNDNVRDKSTKRSMFRRNRSTRSRGSFIDNDGQRRVKEEYA
eukprot:GHVU01236342.1.p1 GENE.GHVU01236342.1~~GHVU01236342.1.p1  ORF type:complete len:258 (+),score=19.27 GHVU01236342.1:162-935(+)